MAARSFPPALQHGAHAIYWFCRHTDDLVDEAPDVETARVQLAAWEKALQSAFQQGRSDDPILHLFTVTLNEFRVPREYAYELIAGVRMDLTKHRYESFDELRLYCYRVASTVGLMMSHVIGYREGALPYAEEMGVAMQLTNILRDIGEDHRRGRIYIPRQELQRFGIAECEFPGDPRDERFRRLMRFQVARARDAYAAACPGVALLAPHGQFAVRSAALYYGRILDHIERAGYDTVTRRAVVPKWEKLALLVKAWAA
jgi:phytoene synthase